MDHKKRSRIKGGEIIVVYRDERVKEIARKYKAKCIFNPNAHLGQSEGIKLGLREIEVKDGVMFLPGDMPLLKGRISID
ncbi:nucleotidyltransferase family protein [Caloramator sp. Dgby_cultured_2]|uniref:nucleotidyltransferase family protein n=1 Tax=Caloramator sp. Dgby_cultured_2 TaxID=3029174 RepID=UPI00237EE0F8|nr:nucleotidyltransferase family protein [Caloramator sp. Dgby_cultured_2]WDU82387.1 nucleotidyltransferase family protein [Caloramator sp. Dgby_cultured_2]